MPLYVTWEKAGDLSDETEGTSTKKTLEALPDEPQIAQKAFVSLQKSLVYCRNWILSKVCLPMGDP